MVIRRLSECKEFAGGDLSALNEYLHPAKEKLAIRYSLARAVVKPGRQTHPHRMKTSEVYYILKGRGMMHVDGKSGKVGASDVVYIPPGAIQHIRNTGKGDLVFLCIVDPAWRIEDEEVLPR